MISESPERFSFQLNSAMERNPDNDDIASVFEQIRNEHKHKFDDPEKRKNNLEYDLRTNDWILEKVRTDKKYAQHLYAALCNNDFQKQDVVEILKDNTWSCSWRSAGGIIADMRQKGDYIEWYLSGVSLNIDNDIVPEGDVTDEVRSDLLKLGWTVK